MSVFVAKSLGSGRTGTQACRNGLHKTEKGEGRRKRTRPASGMKALGYHL